ncbi:MAG: hypothetical protein ACE5JL_02750 [Dehalococcoidia bacterium]
MVMHFPHQRKLPRPFELPWGRGVVVEEVSILRPHWEPTIQLLEYEDGSVALRFCYYHGSRFGRGPMILSKEDIADMKTAAQNSPRIKALLRGFA